MLLLEVTALLLARDDPVLTGIGRVDHALARWMCDSGRDAAFLVNWGGLRGVIGPAAMARELDRMEQRRGGGGLLDRVWEALSRPPLPGQIGVLRIGADIRRGAPARLRTALAALVHAPGWQRLARGGMTGVHYVHASHRALEHGGQHRWAEARRVRSTVFIHDLIPLEHPQFCGAGARVVHGPKLATAARLGAVHPHGRIAVNSDHTRARLEHWLGAAGLPVPTIEVHRLGTAAAAPDGGTPGGTRPYFLCAGTIEGRKNIGLLIGLWRALAASLPAGRVPALVLAGSRGWACADVLAQLDGARDIAPHVIEVAGLTDAELGALMDGARAVLTPSLAEGFSLVPAEALARGVPVIASDIPAHREMQGGAVLIDPRDMAAWRSAVEAAAVLPPARRVRTVARTWDDFASGLLA